MSASIRRLEDRVGYHLVRTALRVRRRYADNLAECGLQPNQHAILSLLHESGPDYQKALAQRIAIDAGDLVSYLDSLEAQGLVERTRDPQDRRRHLVSITTAGRRTLRGADDALDHTEESLFGHLTKTQRDDLIAVLQSVLPH